MTQDRAATVLTILKQKLPLASWAKARRDPFETFVITIISQNTADRNTNKAFKNLSNLLEITPEALANAKISQIEEAIRTAGLYRAKAKTIKNAAKCILERFHGSLGPILQMPLEEARKTFMEFHGVGPKTADVVLLFSANQPTIPVDTHVNRVAKRLGFAPENGNYEVVRCCLQKLYDPVNYLAVHLLFIEHGRQTCKAPRPLCGTCPVNKYCPSNGKWDKK